MRRSKYPSLGILDALHKYVFGFSSNPSQQGLYESLGYEKPSTEVYSKRLYSLEHNGYITRDGHRLSLTSKGKKKTALRTLEKISLSKRSDGFRRLIAFDIPEKMRHARDVLRSKLKAFECDKIQKSLYVTPYICEQEIQEISRILHIERYVTVL